MIFYLKFRSQQTTAEDPNNSPSATDTQAHHAQNAEIEHSQKLIESEIEQHQSNGQSNATEIVYTPSANPIATSVLQYSDTSNKLNQNVPIDATTNVLISTAPPPTIDGAIEENKGKSHIIYTHGDKAYVEAVKDIYDNGKVPIYATTATADDPKQQPLDLIYEDGGKTVIYTTNADPKSLELYAGNELNLLEGHQVIVQGPNVYVVAAPPSSLDAEINAQTNSTQAHLQR